MTLNASNYDPSLRLGAVIPAANETIATGPTGSGPTGPTGPTGPAGPTGA